MFRFYMIVSLFCFLTFSPAFSTEKATLERVPISQKQYDALLEIGDYLAKSGELKRSGVIYSITEIIRPNSSRDSDFYYKWAIQQGRSGEFGQAVEFFNRAAKIDPAQTDQYFQCLMILRTCKL